MLADLLTFGLLAFLVGLMAIDVVRPARYFPKIRFWRTKGIVAAVVILTLSTFLPLVWDAWLGAHRVFDLTGLGTLGGALVGLLGYQLVAYWWHRALHGVPLLWRFHQMHHSAERIDIYGANWFHPLDMLGWVFVPSFALVLVFGVTAEAAVIAVVTSNALAWFGHANLRTPAWLGYVIQRPENHASHHQRGVHANNYGDISLFDMLFGTWRNPKTFAAKGGFYDGASTRVPEMLLGFDVTTPRARDERRASSVHPTSSGSFAQ